MPVLYANNAASRLAASITNAATSFSVTAGHGVRFPAISGGDHFYATLMDSAGNLEVVKVTARATDTFTVQRAQEGTTARAYAANDIVELRITKAMLDDFKTDTRAGNASTATTLQTARTFTIGATGRTFNGSANVSWTLAEIGAAASSHTQSISTITGIIEGTTFVGTYPVMFSIDGSTRIFTHSNITYTGSTNTLTAPNFSGALSGNATTATTLQAARTINGTSFNGSANITTANWGTARTINGSSINGSANVTTANWGTARTLTIGDTGKSVNGSANVAWSVGEIGAESLHTFGVPRSNLGNPTVREMALFDAQFDNKTERFNIAQMFVETSTDNVTWTAFSISDTNKRLLVGGDGFGGGVTIPYNTPYFRIRLRATSYVYLNALYMYWSSNGHSSRVQVYKKHDSGSWTQHTSSTTLVSAWPGHLYLPFSTIPWNPTAALGTHWHEVYVVFQPTWSASFPSNGITLNKMQWWGGYPAGRRNLYGTNELGDASFPAALSAVGTVTAPTFSGALSGNATTATTLQTARTINGVSFNGSANITVADATKLPLAGGTMTGAISFAAGQTWPTFNQSTTGNAATATALQTARTIGGVSFNGSANINLPGVNTAGNQNTTGSAATLTTARTINGTSFNGSANITTANWGTARTINGSSVNGSANVTTANWGTARTLTIGNTGKSVNGSANVAWTLAEIGALPLSGGAITTSGSTSSLIITDTGASGANIRLNGNGATTPNKTIRAFNGTLEIINNGYTAPCMTVTDAGNLTAAGNVTANSDERLKKDWSALPADFIERLATTKSGTYTRTDSGDRQAGASAQDWQALLPEVVSVGSDDRKTLSLAYGNAALVSAIELAKRLLELEKDFAVLKEAVRGPG